jgi:two-component system sensor histidine kinase/response regulator
MRQSGDRQLTLINSLLESRVNDMHGMIIHRESVSIEKVIQSAIDDLQPLVEKEDSVINLQIPLNLAPISCDALQICRVFQNLIANAIKHNPPSLKITISVEMIETNQKTAMRCVVADNGVGITSAQSEHLFELYTQSQTNNQLNRRSLSLGLGLYICRQIVQAHGGAIGATGEENIGSRFWFTLPIE